MIRRVARHHPIFSAFTATWATLLVVLLAASAGFRSGFLSFVVKGAHVAELRVGDTSITLSPGGTNVIRWSAAQAPTQAMDIGMTADGHPQGFVGGAAQQCYVQGDTVTVVNGGTGSTTAAGARTALGVPSTAAVQSAIYGFKKQWKSSTQVSVGAGNAIALDGTSSLSYTPVAPGTLDITTTGALGLDTLTSAATCTTNGTATVTVTASAYTDLTAWTKGMDGNYTSSGTTLTGVGTKWATVPSQVKKGDLIKSSQGASRVSSITNDTTIVLVAAFPGGDVASGEAGSIIEEPTIGAGATNVAIDKISKDGLTVTTSDVTENGGAGRTLKYGVQIASGKTLAQRWYYVICTSGGTGTTVVLDTGRSKYNPPSGYNSANQQRLVGAVYTDSSANIDYFVELMLVGTILEYEFKGSTNANNFLLLNNGAAATWTDVDASSYHFPMCESCTLSVTAANCYAQVKAKWLTIANATIPADALQNGAVSGTCSAIVPVLLDGRGHYDYEVGGTTKSVYHFLAGISINTGTVR